MGKDHIALEKQKMGLDNDGRPSQMTELESYRMVSVNKF